MPRRIETAAGLQVMRMLRRRPVFIILWLAVAALLLGACAAEHSEDRAPTLGSVTNSGAAPGEAADPDPETTEELIAALNPHVVTAHNRLGMLIFGQLVSQTRPAGGADAETDDESVFISPISIALALGMAYNGAAGETETAMAKALQLEGLLQEGLLQEALLQEALLQEGPRQEGLLQDSTTTASPDADGTRLTRADINASNLALLEALTGTGARLDIATSIWYRQEFALNPAFVEETQRYYRARISALDFAAPESVDVINRWVSDATRGLIPAVVDQLDEDQIMLLLNAVYFKGDWTAPFDPQQTRDMPFYRPSGDSRPVPMMYQDGRFGYFEDGFQAVRLPYGDDERLAMYVFLPPRGADFYEFSASLDYETLADAFSRFVPGHGEVLLPRMDVSYKTRLNAALQELGMGIAFDPGRADFSRLHPAGSRNIYISDVIHQSVLKVDEEGTEAAAVTSVDFRVTSLPVYDFRFQADRPFVVVIRDDATGALLFVGAVVDPGV